MKNWVKRFGTIALAGTLLVGGTTLATWLEPSTAAYAESNAGQNANTVSVVGNGKITVKPDIAYLTLGVETTAKSAEAAQSSNAAIMAKLNALLKNTWKIDAADIQTGQFSVGPNYVYNDKDGQKVNGYIARHTLEVKYRQLDKVGQLLDDASKAGVNKISNIQFTVENPDQFQEQVITKAMQNANVKANAIAKAANRQVGKVVQVAQNDAGAFPVRTESYSTMDGSLKSAGSSVEPGTIEVQTSLSVLYELK